MMTRQTSEVKVIYRQILTGKTQGRINEYKTYKRIPNDISIFEDFANGLGMPAAARCALGLDPEAAGSGPSGQASGRSAEVMGATPGDVQPLLSTELGIALASLTIECAGQRCSTMINRV